MATPLLPPLLQHGTGWLFFTLGVFLIAAHTLLATRAAEQSRLQGRARTGVPLAIALFLAAWFGLAIAVGGAIFPTAPPLTQLSLLAAISGGPLLLGVTLTLFSRRLQTLNRATPSAWLIWIQSYRVLGLIFLWPFLAYGLVPAAFALPAALGDFLTGAMAPWVGSAVARRRPHATAWAWGWNLFGLLDLLVAPASAILSHAHVLGLYPLVLVPLFIGPPLGILTHLYSLRNLASARRAQLPQAALSPA